MTIKLVSSPSKLVLQELCLWRWLQEEQHCLLGGPPIESGGCGGGIADWYWEGRFLYPLKPVE